MNKKDITRLAQEAGFVGMDGDHGALRRFAALVVQRERDELIVMFLEAHEGAKDNHNYWHVAANKIKEKK